MDRSCSIGVLASGRDLDTRESVSKLVKMMRSLGLVILKSSDGERWDFGRERRHPKSCLFPDPF